MAKKKYQVVGRVVSSQQGVPNVRVEAWDKDLIYDDLISSVVTGADGRFQMQFDASSFSNLFLDRRPDLFFKLYYEDQLIASTEDSVLWNVAAGETEIVIEVGLESIVQQPKGDWVMPKQTGGKGSVGGKGTGGKGTVGGKGPGGKGPGGKGPGGKGPGGKGPGGKGPGGKGPGNKGPKKGNGTKKGNGPKKKGKGKYKPANGSDFVCVIISKKCALELATAISLAVGFPVTPGKKKKGKKKKGKGGKGKG